MEKILDTAFLIAAGGSSSRFGSENKLFAMLDGKPVFTHCIRTASSLLPDNRIVMAVPKTLETQFRNLAEQHLPGITIRFVHGGKTRTESVFNALKELDSKLIKIVAVHDAARPFLTPGLLLRSVESARKHSGAVVCRKICDTVKSADDSGTIIQTVPREKLWAAQTPQTFSFSALLSAYRKAMESGAELTDDSSVMEQFGGIRPVIVENNSSTNLKITYPEDLELASLIAHHQWD